MNITWTAKLQMKLEQYWTVLCYLSPVGSQPHRTRYSAPGKTSSSGTLIWCSMTSSHNCTCRNGWTFIVGNPSKCVLNFMQKSTVHKLRHSPTKDSRTFEFIILIIWCWGSTFTFPLESILNSTSLSFDLEFIDPEKERLVWFGGTYT